METQQILPTTTFDGTGTIQGPAVKANAYYNKSGIFTVTGEFEDFDGSVFFEGSLVDNPTAEDWVTLQDTANIMTGHGLAGVETQTFADRGNFVWIRANVTFTAGTINYINITF